MKACIKSVTTGILMTITLTGCCTSHQIQIVQTHLMPSLIQACTLDPNDMRYQLRHRDYVQTPPRSLLDILHHKQSDQLNHLVPTQHRITQTEPTTLAFTQQAGQPPFIEACINEFPNEPIIPDTGCPWLMSMKTSDTARLCLPVYPFTAQKDDGSQLGFCFISQMQLGDLHIQDLVGPCHDNSRRHTLSDVNNRDYDHILLGLPVLRQFKYIRFNNASGRITLSQYESFNVQDESKWQSYRFTLDNKNGTAIIVQMKLANEPCRMIFDTGSGLALAIKQSLWHKMGGQKLSPHMQYQTVWAAGHFGKTECRAGTVTLGLGGHTIHNIDIQIFNNTIPLRNCDGIFGLRLFPNATVVLDFETQSLWIQWPETHDTQPSL